MLYIIQVLLTDCKQDQFRPEPARELSANPYDIYHCCVYSEELLMMDIGTVQKMQCFYSKNKFEKLVNLVGIFVGTDFTDVLNSVQKYPT